MRFAETVIKRQGFSDAQLVALHNSRPETEIGYRLAWARSHLKGMSLLTNSARGIWALTDAGIALVTDPAGTDSWRRGRVRELWQAHLVESRKAGGARPPRDVEPDAAEPSAAAELPEEVFFQCKRYQCSVGSGAVRDFRGAMAGRGDKGVLITTGSFTTKAKKEAARDGAPPIDLIDGDRLCQLLKQYELGVRTVTQTVEDVSTDPAFFGEI